MHAANTYCVPNTYQARICSSGQIPFFYKLCPGHVNFSRCDKAGSNVNVRGTYHRVEQEREQDHLFLHDIQGMCLREGGTGTQLRGSRGPEHTGN